MYILVHVLALWTDHTHTDFELAGVLTTTHPLIPDHTQNNIAPFMTTLVIYNIIILVLTTPTSGYTF